jgi:DNA-directed RNA polymerase specialized sigma24 family protein
MDMDTSSLTTALTSMDADDPDVGLRAAVALRRLAEQVEAKYVAMARLHGWSWEQIGDALGVSRQAAHTKHRKATR